MMNVEVSGFEPTKVKMGVSKDRYGIGCVKVIFFDDDDNHVGITLTNEQAIKLAANLKSSSDYSKGLKKL